MATYYVSVSDGNDNRSKGQAQNIGTPWKTIKKANENVVAGDTVSVDDGDYIGDPIKPTGNGIAGSPITYISRNYRQATLKRTKYAVDLTEVGSTLLLMGLLLMVKL